MSTPFPIPPGAALPPTDAVPDRVARWWLVPAVALLGLLAIAAAGWWGYRTQQLGWPVAAEASGPGAVTAAAAAASTATTSGSPLPDPVVAARAGGTGAGTAGSPDGLRWPMWEFKLQQPIPPRNPSLTPPSWRMIGATLSQGVWSVIVVQQGKTDPDYLTVGQELPGGYRIEHIDDEGVTLAQGKRKMLLSYLNSR